MGFPPDQRRGPVRVYGWQWGPDEQRRPGLPWLGVFLVVFGALLVIERLFPAYRNLGDVFVLAAGLASLVIWAVGRGTLALYAGAFLTALALPGTLEGLGIASGPGWGTLSFGLAFLFVALVRYSRGGGWGWQAFYGSILALLGASQVAVPSSANLLLPLVLLILGAILLLRGSGRPWRL